MNEVATLQGLIDDGTIGTVLRKGSSSRHAIESLQTLLHWLGFDEQLKWERFGADGDYGSATTAAVADFARRNGSQSAGERVTEPLARKMVARYESLDELKQLAEDVRKQRVGTFYKASGGDKLRISALQTLLNDLGHGAELKWDRFGADGDYGKATIAAVAAFGARTGLGGDGRELTPAQGQRIVSSLGAFYGRGWDTPGPQPPAVAGALNVRPSTGSDGAQWIEVSDGALKVRFKKFRKGLVTYGRQKPADFVRDNQAELRRIKISQSEINVMLAVAENEGNLDAINTWDNAFLSFGIFQWTAGTDSSKGELPGLLARIKDEDADLFRKYYGQHGLDVVGVGSNFVTGHFSLHGTPIKSPAAKAQLREAPWAFRFWASGQDPAIQALEIKHALSRLDRFYTASSDKVGAHFISDLVTSEYGVGLILDNHVNRPAYVKQCLDKAMKKTGLSKPERWGDGEERALIDAYLEIRITHGSTPMTDAAKRGRVTRKYVTNGTISDRRGSFKRSTG